jgi:hypothetical protein
MSKVTHVLAKALSKNGVLCYYQGTCTFCKAWALFGRNAHTSPSVGHLWQCRQHTNRDYPEVVLSEGVH